MIWFARLLRPGPCPILFGLLPYVPGMFDPQYFFSQELMIIVPFLFPFKQRRRTVCRFSFSILFYHTAQ